MHHNVETTAWNKYHNENILYENQQYRTCQKRKSYQFTDMQKVAKIQGL